MAPFSLLTYEDVSAHATDIVKVTSSRVMPPWLPAPGFGDFAEPRVLTVAEIDRIARWVAEGAAEGAPAERRAMPTWSDDWTLGRPDLIVELPEPYLLKPGNEDEFRNFVLPIPLPSARYVRGIEVRPGNRHVVHHATIGIDSTRASRMLDGADPAPGYEGMFSSGAHSPSSHAIGWTPGMTPRLDPPDTAWRLDPGSDLVIQLHMMPRHLTRAEPIRPMVAFYFSATPPKAESIDFKLGSKSIDIPPGAAAFEVRDEYRLPVDVDVLSIYPHAHFLGREMKVFATLPDSSVQWLLWIKRWDFNWQDQYQFARPVPLPRGALLTMQYVYDNSASNPANPNQPPRRVLYGPQSSDEMGDLWLRLRPRTGADATTLARGFVAHEREQDTALAVQRLAAEPDQAHWLGMLGALRVEAGQLVDGIAYLRRAIARDPRNAAVQTNLGLALKAKGDLREAIVHLARAAELAPDNDQIHANLAEALQDAGDLTAAIGHLKSATRINAASAELHNNLGVALASHGDVHDAVQEFEKALKIRPDYPDADKNLALASALLAPTGANRTTR